MVIQSSNVAMQAQRTYTRYQADQLTISSWGNAMDKMSQTATTLPTAKDSVNESDKVSIRDQISSDLIDLYEQGLLTYDSITVKKNSFSESYLEGEVQYQSFQNMLTLMFGEKLEVKRITPQQLFLKLLETRKEALYQALSGNLAGMISPTQEYEAKVVYKDFYAEEENTSFTSTGNVVTADGRTISFDIQAKMSNTFLSYEDVSIDYEKVARIDPLVIQLGTNQVEVTDQTFLFDIDMDGEKDNIAVLSEMCGYLAYDKNEDGVINDGSELFGAKTGDGFEELAVFDIDHNGWIDEQDEIFNHLRVWTKDADGKDKLVALGVAGVGAIYLSNLATNFTVREDETKDIKGEIKSTGIYLTEDGEVKTIQQFDHAVKK